MNIIRTLGDLRAHLALYDPSLPIEFFVISNGDKQPVSLNNSTQIEHVVGEYVGRPDTLAISLVQRAPTAVKFSPWGRRG